MKKISLALAAFVALFVCQPIFARIPVKVACIGDGDNLYPSVLQNIMGSEYDVRSFDCNTMTISGDVRNFLPDIVIIMPFDYGMEQFETGHRKLIKEMKSLDSHPDIFLCHPPTATADVIPVIDNLASSEWLDVIDTHSAAGASDIAASVADALKNNGYSENPGKRVLFIGDSVTDGEWGGGSARPSSKRNHYDGNHLLGHGFPEMCAARYMADFPERETRFYNRGISGNALPSVAERWDSDVLAVHPDVVSILVGINDACYWSGDAEFDFDTWDSLYRSLIDRTLSADPDVKFLLCSPFVSDKSLSGEGKDYAARRPIVEKLAAIVKNIAHDYGFVYVDTFSLVDNLVQSDNSSDHRYWMWDGIHPTTACHQKIADLWISSSAAYLR